MNLTTNTDKLITVKNYAAVTINPRTGKPYSVKQIYRMITEGKITGVKIDGKQFVLNN